MQWKTEISDGISFVSEKWNNSFVPGTPQTTASSGMTLQLKLNLEASWAGLPKKIQENMYEWKLCSRISNLQEVRASQQWLSCSCYCSLFTFFLIKYSFQLHTSCWIKSVQVHWLSTAVHSCSKHAVVL